VGIGSTFTLTIPIQYGAVKTLERATSKHQTTQPVVSTKPIVLAIDDDSDVIYLLQENLSEAGYQVIGAAGEEAVARAKELKPYAITLDIMMPKRDGWQVLQDLKGEAATRDIPVIMLSIIDKKAMGYRLGAADYLLKPLNGEALLSSLKRVAQINQTQIAHVLVIDDDPEVHNLTKQLLDGHFKVESALDGVAGIEAVKQQRPDAILLDLMMPRLDGFGVIEQLQRDPQYGHIPIIVITAKELTNEEAAKLQQSVSRVIQKQGLAGETLLQELQTVLKKYKT
jgi:CheY-like chemotaxis protein